MNLENFELDKIWEEISEAENKRYQKDQEILKLVEESVSNTVYNDILYSIEMSENTYDYLITNKPEGEFQKEEDFESLDGQWVNQTTNGGYIGDEFAGTISIKINEDKYFQFSYSM